MQLPLRYLLLVLLLLPLTSRAVTLRVCVDQVSHLPVLTPQLGGTAGVLIKMAAHEARVDIAVITAPLARCREMLRANQADAFPVTPFLTHTLPFLSFPTLTGGSDDPSRAVTHFRNMVFRLKPGKPSWDGVRFHGLEQPVLASFGASLVRTKLESMKVAFDDNGKTPEVNFRKMLAGRGALVVALEIDGLKLLDMPEFRNTIDMLPRPFTDEPYYLGLSTTFVDTYPGVAEKLWNAIAPVKQSPAYQAVVKELLEQAAKASQE